MRLVIIESPYAGTSSWRVIAFFQRMRNRRYARRAVRDSLSRGEAPIASHLLYTQRGVLCDEVPAERKWGIEAGLAWRRKAELSAAYTDHGISRGMNYGLDEALRAGVPVVYRKLK